MAVDLPGIRARAEWNLAAFKQQEAEIIASLRRVSEEMRAVPSAKIKFDLSGSQAAASAAAKQVGNQFAEEVARRQEFRKANARADAEIAAAEKARAAAEAKAVKESLEQQKREFDKRFAERIKQIDAETAAAKKAFDQQDKDEVQSLRARIREQEAFADRQRRARDARIREERANEREQAGQTRREARVDVGVGAGASVLGAVIVKDLIDATAAAADFEKAFSQVKAVLTVDEVNKSSEAIRTLAFSLGRQGLGFTATEALTALEAMAKAGIIVKDQLAGAPAVLALAAAGNISLADSANLAASAIQTFGLSGTDLTRVANVLTGVSNATIADLDQLRMSFSQVSAVAAAHNQTIEQTSLALGIMAQAGIKSSDAGTSLRVMLLRLQPETARQQQIMQQYGVIQNGVNQLIDQSTGKFKSLAEISEILKNAFGGLTDAQQEFALRTIFGQDAVRAATVLIKEGAKGFDELAQAAFNGRTAVEVAQERLNNLRGDMTKLNAAWTETQILFGKAIEPNLRPIVQAISGVIQTANQASPELKTMFVTLLGGTAAVLTISGAIAGLVGVFTLLGGAAVVFPAIAGFVTAILVPVAALTAAAVLLGSAWVNNWGGIKDKTEDASKIAIRSLTDITKLVEGLIEISKEPINITVNIVGNAVGGLGNAGKDVLDFAGEVLDKAGVQINAKVEDVARTVAKGGARNILGSAGADVAEAYIDGFLRTIEAKKKIAAIEAQRAFEESQTPQMRSEQITRSADIFIKQGNDSAEAFIGAFQTKFKDLPSLTEDSIRDLMVSWQDQIRTTFKTAFPDISGDVLERLVEVLTTRANERFAAAGQQAADGYVGPWLTAFNKLTETNQEFERALALSGSDIGAIGVLIQLDRANKVATQGFKELKDEGILAALIVERNHALELRNVQQRTEALIAVGEKYKGLLDAQAKSEKDAADFIKNRADIEKAAQKVVEDRANAIIKAADPALNQEQKQRIEQLVKEGQANQAAAEAARIAGVEIGKEGDIAALTGAQIERLTNRVKAAAEAEKTFAEVLAQRAGGIAKAAAPGLSADQQAFIETLIKQGDAYKAAQFAGAAFNVMIADQGTLARATGAEIEQMTARLGAIAKASDINGNTFRISTERAKSFFDQIIKDVPAAEQAHLEFVSATEGPLEAIRRIWTGLGLEIGKLPDIATASATAVKQALQQIEARRFFLETGDLLPAHKVETAGDQFEKAANKASEQLSKARDQISKELQKAQQQWAEDTDKAAKELSKAQDTFAKEFGKIDSDLANTLADIDAAVAKAVQGAVDANAKIDDQEERALAGFSRAMAERQRAFEEQNSDAAEKLGEQLQQIQEQIGQASFDAIQRQREQISQLSAQLAQLRAQEADTLRQASISLEDIAIKELKATTGDERQQLARERIRLQAEQGAAAVALQKQISQGQAEFNKSLEDQQLGALKQIADLQKQGVKAVEEFEKDKRRRLEEFQRQNLEANTRLIEQFKEFDARRLDINAKLADQLRELQKRREDAKKQAEEAKRKAEEALKESQRQHDEAIAKANEQLNTEERNAAVSLKDANDKHKEEMNTAVESLNEARKQAGLTENLRDLASYQAELLEKLLAKREPFRIEMNNANIEEGDVEFLERAAEQAEELANAPIG